MANQNGVKLAWCKLFTETGPKRRITNSTSQWSALSKLANKLKNKFNFSFKYAINQNNIISAEYLNSNLILTFTSGYLNLEVKLINFNIFIP